MALKILVVGYESDVQTAHQIKTLRDHDAEVRIISADLTPGESQFSWTKEGVVVDDVRIGRIDAALIRSLPPSYLSAAAFPQPLDWPSYFNQFCLQRDRSDTLLGFLLALDSNHVPCWNPPDRSLLVRRKPFQLDVIRTLGCPVPETLITNNPKDASGFLELYPDAIVKPAAGGALTLNAGELSRDELNRIQLAPAIFQQRIRGDDIRVIVAGTKVISSACILVPPDTIDFRGNHEYAQGRIDYEEVRLPAKLEQDCLRICTALGYRYAGLDLKRTASNDFVFLECNNSPIYLDVENKLGHPITRMLINEILESARTHLNQSSAK
jgi:glutathione synthase/RimK-type ligase-like ATP-grasp enzyme